MEGVIEMPDGCLNPDKIQDYVENSLPPGERQGVAVHLEGCAACRRDAEAFARLFAGVAASARQQLAAGCPRQSLVAVMQRLPKKRGQANSAIKPEITSHSVIAMLMKWLFMPALALTVLLWFAAGSQKLPKPAVDDALMRSFSLLDNSVVLILGELPANVKDKIEPATEVSLGKDSVVLVNVAQHQLKFSAAASFVFSQNEIDLKQGQAAFDLTGDHQGFRIKTPLVTITPLGTSFELAVKTWGVTVVLHSGRLELVSITGIRRILDAGQTIYVAADGRFSVELPQSEPDVPQGQPSSQSLPVVAPAGNPDSPNRLIDSF